MSKYLELIESAFTQEHLDKQKNQNPYVAYSIEEDKVIYSIISKHVVYDPYVTFTAEEDNSSIGLEKLSTNQTIEYSIDTTTWNNFDTTTNISLNNGDKVYVRGILSTDNTSSNYTQFKMSGKIAASGSCNAIWNYKNLEAPLKAYCGFYMFVSCASLTIAPELPATTLAPYCYDSIFGYCTSLTAAPELPTTTLAEDCYSSMFASCTSLTIAPDLPATTLARNCYRSMFYNCTSLTTAPDLPATELAENCYQGMFKGCTSLTTAPELPATKLVHSCYQGMFSGCTSLTTAPELPATKLVSYCYRSMFENCIKLNYIKCLATDRPTDYCTYNWIKGALSTGNTGVFIKHPDMNDWPTTGAHGIPYGWTVVDAVL